MDPLRFAPRMTREANVWIPSRADAWSRMTKKAEPNGSAIKTISEIAKAAVSAT